MRAFSLKKKEKNPIKQPPPSELSKNHQSKWNIWLSFPTGNWSYEQIHYDFSSPALTRKQIPFFPRRRKAYILLDKS